MGQNYHGRLSKILLIIFYKNMPGIWKINRNGISLNEGGRFITFSIVRIKENNPLGFLYLRFYLHPFAINIYFHHLKRSK